MLEGRSKLVSVTHGMANAMLRGKSPSRLCDNCKMGFPKYAGRYPSKCPRCGGSVSCVKAEGVESRLLKLQELIDAGTQDGDVVTIPLESVEEIHPGGVFVLHQLLEGPEGGYYFRLEGPTDPVLIFEINRQAVTIRSVDEPARYLGHDPREGLIVPGGLTEADARLRAAEKRLLAEPGSFDAWVRAAVTAARAGKMLRYSFGPRSYVQVTQADDKPAQLRVEWKGIRGAGRLPKVVTQATFPDHARAVLRLGGPASVEYVPAPTTKRKRPAKTRRMIFVRDRYDRKPKKRGEFTGGSGDAKLIKSAVVGRDNRHLGTGDAGEVWIIAAATAAEGRAIIQAGNLTQLYYNVWTNIPDLKIDIDLPKPGVTPKVPTQFPVRVWGEKAPGGGTYSGTVDTERKTLELGSSATGSLGVWKLADIQRIISSRGFLEVPGDRIAWGHLKQALRGLTEMSAGIVMGRVQAGSSAEFLDGLRDWVNRYGEKGALIKGEANAGQPLDLVIPVHGKAQHELVCLAAAHGVTVERGTHDANTGLRWVPMELQEGYYEPIDLGDGYVAVPCDGDCDHAREAARAHMAEADDDGTECMGVFLRVPKDIAKDFPSLGDEDSSPPHCTLLFIGPVARERYGEVVAAVRDVCEDESPFTVEMTDYGEFQNDAGQTIAHMIPRSLGTGLDRLHGRLRDKLQSAGIDVAHHDGPFKAHVTLAYLNGKKKYEGKKPQGVWICNELEVWGSGVWREGQLANTVIKLGSGKSKYVEETFVWEASHRVELTRPEPGKGATRAHGGYRFTIGKNRKRTGRKDVRASIQNRLNSQRGQARRIIAARKWHQSAEGKRMHRDLGRYNRGNKKGGQVSKPQTEAFKPTLRADGKLGMNAPVWLVQPSKWQTRTGRRRHIPSDHAIGWISGFALEKGADIGGPYPGHGSEVTGFVVSTPWGEIKGTLSRADFELITPKEFNEHWTVVKAVDYRRARAKGLAEEVGVDVVTVDDAFDEIIRKLITIESLDVLQDVEFTDEGAIYLFFDPVLSQDEIQEVMMAVSQANPQAQLVGSPDRSLPGEIVKADWWVIFAPYKEGEDGTLVPDPQVWAADPEQAKGAPAPQTFVKPALTTTDQIALDVDVSQLMQALGEATPTKRGPLLALWSDASRRRPRLRGTAQGASGKIAGLYEAAKRGEGTLFLVRARNADEAQGIIERGGLRAVAPTVLTNEELPV